ncbi:MAG: hypothetical protein LBT05_15645 [Planctomycetaceae bacterium]|jgi:hypothetical protein|nr:hypothetical protein [Planctomycetaceae bacterium]
MKRIFPFFLIFTLTLNACSYRPKLERPEGMPELLPCSITATFGGKIVKGVTVSLTPLEGNKTWSPSGTTNDNGTAYPETSYGFKGVPVGQYRVSFTCFETNPNYDENNPKSPWAKSFIPLKYSKSQSKKTLEVQTDGKNNFVFTLDAGEEPVLANTKL